MEKMVFVLFVLATLVQVGLWLFFYSKVAFWDVRKGSLVAGFNRLDTGFQEKSVSNPLNPPTNLTKKPALSVLICARNEAENLRKNLPFILSQDFPDFEIIVVNDASTDETAAVLTDFLMKNSRLRVISIVEKKSVGKKAALAEAIRAAKNDCLVLTDADCQPASRFWLQKMAAGFLAEKEIVLGFGPYRRKPGLTPLFLNVWIRFEACWTAVQYFAAARSGRPYMGVGRNLAWSKPLFERTSGFLKHADLPSGDDDLFVSEAATRRNTACCIDSDAFVFSEPQKTWHSYFQQKKRHFSTGNRYQPGQKWLLAIAALSHGWHYLGLGLLVLTEYSMMFVLMCYIVRITVVCFIWTLILRKFQDWRLLLFVPFLDFGLILHYLAFSPFIFFSSYNKSVPWK